MSKEKEHRLDLFSLIAIPLLTIQLLLSFFLAFGLWLYSKFAPKNSSSSPFYDESEEVDPQLAEVIDRVDEGHHPSLQAQI